MRGRRQKPNKQLFGCDIFGQTLCPCGCLLCCVLLLPPPARCAWSCPRWALLEPRSHRFFSRRDGWPYTCTWTSAAHERTLQRFARHPVLTANAADAVRACRSAGGARGLWPLHRRSHLARPRGGGAGASGPLAPVQQLSLRWVRPASRPAGLSRICSRSTRRLRCDACKLTSKEKFLKAMDSCSNVYAQPALGRTASRCRRSGWWG